MIDMPSDKNWSVDDYVKDLEVAIEDLKDDPQYAEWPGKLALYREALRDLSSVEREAVNDILQTEFYRGMDVMALQMRVLR